MDRGKDEPKEEFFCENCGLILDEAYCECPGCLDRNCVLPLDKRDTTIPYLPYLEEPLLEEVYLEDPNLLDQSLEGSDDLQPMV